MSRKRSNRGLGIFVAILMGLCIISTGIILLRFWDEEKTVKPDTSLQATTEATEPSTQVTEETQPTFDSNAEIYTVSLLAVGNNLVQEPVYESGSEDWSYEHLFTQIKSTIQAADIAVISEETTFVTNHIYVSGEPKYGTPRELGEAVYDAGFDVICHASEHAMDKGLENVYDAVDFWSDKEVAVLGIHKTEEDAKTPVIYDKNGIKIGMLNYAYGLVNSTPPEDTFAIDFIDNEQKLATDLAYCEKNADITVCFLHIGEEDSAMPSKEAEAAAAECIDGGAEIVICTHPHVIQPYEMVTTAAGNKGLVFFSLGNFLTGEDKLDNVLGGMAKITIQKAINPDGTVTVLIPEYSLVPLVVHGGEGEEFAVYELTGYTDVLGKINTLTEVTVANLQSRFDEIVGTNR